MGGKVPTIVRAFDGSLADAEGLLAVERATFDESPYSPEEIRAMLSRGPQGQQAWLALDGDQVAGFLAAFATHGLQGPSWEMDLLAVHPDAAGRGLATRLIRAAAAHGARLAGRARAVVAAENEASVRAFLRAGFHAARRPCRLLIHRSDNHGLPPRPDPEVAVRPAVSLAEVEPWLSAPPPPGTVPGAGLSLLVAEEGNRPAGYVELLEVQTLLYRGFWIESLVAATHQARAALVQATLARAAASGLDEVGAMVPGSDLPWQRALLDQGFESLGDFDWLVARLPLPGLSASPAAIARPGSLAANDA
jgi:ribosomal protein S18 acetylase RimI-like enzyme